eukprot:08263_5
MRAKGLLCADGRGKFLLLVNLSSLRCSKADPSSTTKAPRSSLHLSTRPSAASVEITSGSRIRPQTVSSSLASSSSFPFLFFTCAPNVLLTFVHPATSSATFMAFSIALTSPATTMASPCMASGFTREGFWGPCALTMTVSSLHIASWCIGGADVLTPFCGWKNAYGARPPHTEFCVSGFGIISSAHSDLV